MMDTRECPFCGSADTGPTTDFDQGRYWRVHCGRCNALGPRARTEANAVKQWNDRSYDKAVGTRRQEANNE